MKIVTDQNGLYAIRKGWFPFTYRYLDLNHPSFWWWQDSRFYLECWGEKERVEKWFGMLNPVVVDKISSM